jgi:hypothetical protein
MLFSITPHCLWMHPKVHPIPYIVHYNCPEPNEAKVVYYVGNRVPFPTQHVTFLCCICLLAAMRKIDGSRFKFQVQNGTVTVTFPTTQ